MALMTHSTPVRGFLLKIPAFIDGACFEMVSLNGFMVQVPECIEETCDNYVVMRHGKTYSLKLSNHHKDGRQCKPCDADVYIDGKLVGTWRIPFGQNIVLERPVDDSGKFTAYKNGSVEAKQAQIDPNSSDTGLIKVVFRPGTKKIRAIRAVIVQPYIIPVGDPYWYWYPNPGWNTITCTTYDGSVSSDSVRYSESISNSYTSNYVQSHSCNSAESTTNLVGGGTGLSEESKQQFTEVEELDYDSEPTTTIFLRLAFRDEVPRPIKETRRVYSTKVPRPL